MSGHRIGHRHEAGAGPRATRGQSRSGQRGVVGGVEVLPFGFLVLVVGVLLVANAWAVVDAKLAVDQSAREATRAYVEAAPGSAAAEAAAAGRSAFAASGRDPAQLELHGGATRYVRCAPATFTASYVVPAISLPLVGGWGRGITVTGRHREVIDPYRAGLGADGGCDG